MATDSLPKNWQEYPATRWSIVLAAAGDADAEPALAWLCERYWFPLYAFVRRRGHSPEDAEDSVQGFFAMLLDGGLVAKANVERGRFRTFLLVCLSRYLSHERRDAQRLKRGGGVPGITLDCHDVEVRLARDLPRPGTPEEDFDRAWMLTLLDRVAAQVQEECEADGNEGRFAMLESFLHGERGEVPLADLADNDGIFPDRCLTRYTLQFTTAPNPDASTPDTSWTTIGTLDYLSAGGVNFSTPARRHRYSFTPVFATSLRLVAVEFGAAIDEIEIYPQVGIVLNGGGLALVAEGGSAAPDNLARHSSATPFADGVITGFPQHAIAHLNDGLYGNDHSWIHDIPGPFAGIALGASVTVDRIAFGRDNTGVFADRTFGLFALQYTSVPNPGAGTPEADWTTIGTLDYQFAGGHHFATPARRHLFLFTPVTATALRLAGSSGNNGFDEIEIYSANTPLDTWRERNFGTAQNTGPAADSADPNHNGIANLVEYALDGDPLGTLAGPAILPQQSLSPAGHVQLTFQRHLDRSDKAGTEDRASMPAR